MPSTTTAAPSRSIDDVAVLALVVEREQVLEARAAAARDADPQPRLGRALGLRDRGDAPGGAGAQLQRGRAELRSRPWSILSAASQLSPASSYLGDALLLSNRPGPDGRRRTDRMPLSALCLRPGDQPGPGGRRSRERPAQRLPARPRPDRAFDPVPPPRVQDAGVRQFRGRPFPHPADPLAGGGADRPRHGPGAAASTRIWPRRSRWRTISATAPSAMPARRRSTRRWPASAASTTICRPSASSPGSSGAMPGSTG